MKISRKALFLSMLAGLLQAADKKTTQWITGRITEMRRETRTSEQGDRVHGRLDPEHSGEVDLTKTKQAISFAYLVYILEDETTAYLVERPIALLGPRSHTCDVKLGQPVQFAVAQDTVLLRESNGKECKTWIKSQKLKQSNGQ